MRRALVTWLSISVVALGLAVGPAPVAGSPAQGLPRPGSASDSKVGRSSAAGRVASLARIRATYRDVILASDPAGYWRLGNESPLNTSKSVDEVGVREMVLNGGSPLQAGAIVGDPNLAWEASTSSKGSVGTINSSPNIYSNEATLETWFKPASTMTAGQIFGMGSTCSFGSGGFAMSLTSSGYVEGTVRLEHGGSIFDLTATSATALSSGAWYHLVLTRDAQHAKLYINGALAGEATDSSGEINSGCTSPMVLTLADGAAGTYDEAVYYGHILSQGEAIAHYQASGQNHLFVDPLCVCSLAIPNSGQVNTSEGFPVDTRNGSQYETFTALSLPGRGPDARFSHYYSTINKAVSGRMGYGWASSLDMSLEDNGATVTVTEDTGTKIVYYQSGLDPDVYQPLMAGVTATLEKTSSTEWTWTRGKRNIVTFNDDGFLTGEVDLNGHGYSVDYVSSTQIDIVADGGRTLEVTLASGKITAVTDTTLTPNRTVAFSYDGSGNLSAYTDAEGGVTLFGYDGAHQLEKMVLPRFSAGGLTAPGITTDYDGNGRVVYQDDQLNRRTTFDYSTPNQTTVTFPGSKVKRYSFDNGFVTAVTLAPGTADEAMWSYGYTDPDTLGFTEVEDPEGQITTVEYDENGNITEIDDEANEPTIAVWDEGGFNELNSVTDGNGVETSYDYDAFGNLEEVSRPIVDDGGDPIDHGSGAIGPAVTTYTMDPDPDFRGDVIQIEDPRGAITDLEYDDATGDLREVEWQVDSAPTTDKVTYDYDGAGRVIESVAPRGYRKLNVGDPTPDPADWTTSYIYDDLNRVLSSDDPLGNGGSRTFDGDGNVVTETDADSNLTTYTYDDANRLTLVTRPDSTTLGYSYDDTASTSTYTDAASNSTVTHYDARGWPDTVTDALSRVTSTSFYDNGQPHVVTQPGSNTITYGYDAAGQLTSIGYSDPATPDVTDIGYDGNGTRTSMTDTNGTQSWAYDSLGNLLSHTDPASRTVSYEYDEGSLNTKITYPGSGKVVNRVFDDAGQLKSVTDWASRTSTFDYDPNSNWTKTTFPSASTNVDVRTYDRADQMTGTTWKRGSTTLGSLTYGARDPNGLVTSVTAAGTGTENNTWGYDDRNQLTTTATEAFGYDPVSNLTNANGVHQVFDPAQQLCWTSPTATTEVCDEPAGDATIYGFDARGNRTTKELPSGTTTSYGFDGANRLATADVPTAYDPDSRQFQLLAGGAARVADGTDGTGTCNGSACAPFTASTVYDVDIAGQGGVPATGVTAVTGTITVTDPDGDGWLTVNAAGDAAAAAIPLQDGQTATATFTARLDSSGEIQLETDVDATVAVDITGYWTPPPAWIPALNYWPVTPAVAAQSSTGTGTCDGYPCGTLPAGTTEVTVAGVGGIPATGVAAVTVALIAQNTTGGQLRVAPNGDASAGDISWDSTFPNAAGSFTVPLKSNGTIDIEVANATDIILAVTGYWKMPTNNDTGLGLNVLEAPERLVDTRDGTGTCDGDPCDQLLAFTEVSIDVAGNAGVPDNATAVMVSVNILDPAGAGLAAIGADLTIYGAPLMFEAGEDAQSSFITSLSDEGTVNVLSWADADLTIDIVGYFTAPTYQYDYDYDATGLRTAKTFEEGPSEGGWRNEYTWDRSGGLPMLLAEHGAAGTSYLIYGPGNTPIYQITKTGDVMYYHQDHLGSTRLLTAANGLIRGALTYNAYGTTKTNTNPIFQEQPLLTYAGEQQDAETGLIYLRARYYDPATGQFASVDPLNGQTREPYAYASANPVSLLDPSGLQAMPGVPPNPSKGRDSQPEVAGKPLPANSEEIRYCATPSHWFLCKDWYDTSVRAIDLAASRYPSDGGRSNALRHLLWSSRLTWDHGCTTAQGFLDRHEAGVPKDRDWRADRRNNAIGVTLATLYQASGRDYFELQALLEAMVAQGGIVDIRSPNG